MTLTHDFLAVLAQLDSPIATALVLLLIFVPACIGVFRSILTFQSEFIIHRRLKNIERALAATAENPVDQALLRECRAEEAVFINVGMRLSPVERAIILDWIRSAPVSISLVKSAWSQVTLIDGQLKVEASRFDRVYMWYGVTASGTLFITATAVLMLILLQVPLRAEAQLLALPAFAYLFSMLALKDVMPYFSARRLKNRLAMRALPLAIPFDANAN